jgi:uncharacterized membrane protein
MSFCDEDGDGSISFAECCRATGKIWLLLVTLVWFVCGVALLVVGIRSYQFLHQFEGINMYSIVLTSVLGGLLIVVGALGGVGVLKMNRWLLGLFSALTAMLAFGVLVLGVVLTSFAALVESVGNDADSVSGGSISLTNGTTGDGSSSATTAKFDEASPEIWIANYLNCTYNACCPSCEAVAADADAAKASALEKDAAGIGKDGASSQSTTSSTKCRSTKVICEIGEGSSNLGEIQPTYCEALRQGGVQDGDSCASLSLHRNLEKQFVKRHTSTVAIVSLAGFIAIVITLILSCYFTGSKKVQHHSESLPEHHHAHGKAYQDKQ